MAGAHVAERRGKRGSPGGPARRRPLLAEQRPVLRGGRQPRILFAAQVQIGPPTFALFTTGFLEAGYRRFIERRLREEFGFRGSPVVINLRVREKRKR